jgi:hypothetical protein
VLGQYATTHPCASQVTQLLIHKSLPSLGSGQGWECVDAVGGVGSGDGSMCYSQSAEGATQSHNLLIGVWKRTVSGCKSVVGCRSITSIQTSYDVASGLEMEIENYLLHSPRQQHLALSII